MTRKRVTGTCLNAALAALPQPLLSNVDVCSGEMYAASIAEYEWPNGSYWLKRKAAGTLPKSAVGGIRIL